MSTCRAAWCLPGRNVHALAEQIFPEVKLAKYTLEAERASSASELLLVGMYGPCKANITAFKGKLLFLSGEWCQPCPGGMTRTDCQFSKHSACVPLPSALRAYYLGPTQTESRNRMQMFYAQYAAMQAGVESLTRVRLPIPK